MYVSHTWISRYICYWKVLGPTLRMTSVYSHSNVGLSGSVLWCREGSGYSLTYMSILTVTINEAVYDPFRIMMMAKVIYNGGSQGLLPSLEHILCRTTIGILWALAMSLHLTYRGGWHPLLLGSITDMWGQSLALGKTHSTWRPKALKSVSLQQSSDACHFYLKCFTLAGHGGWGLLIHLFCGTSQFGVFYCKPFWGNCLIRCLPCLLQASLGHG